MTDNTIIVALIGGAATIIAALFGIIKLRKDKTNVDKAAQSISNISGGSTVVQSGRDSYVIQKSSARALSDYSLKVIRKIADSCFTDTNERKAWGSFDAQIWMECFHDTPGGIVFNYDAFKKHVSQIKVDYIKQSAIIYLKACDDIAVKGSGDEDRIARLSTLYIETFSQLIGYKFEPSIRKNIDQFTPLWNGTEEGWYLVKTPNPKDKRVTFMIFNFPNNSIEQINDLDLHAEVVKRMLEAGVNVLDRLP